MTAYYNEIEPYAADWLENLIAAGHIAPGIVDRRDIRDVTPADLHGFTQCHFFAGIGVWSYALRRAGWPDDRPVWTGSCPCQPFSAAGAGAGFDDERHLWPHWHHLIRVDRPPNVFGEQVASKDGLGWLDLVQADLEGTDYACWPVDLCAAGIGAPHLRQRLWFTAHDELADLHRDRRYQGRAGFTSTRYDGTVGNSTARKLVDGLGAGLERQRWDGGNCDESGRQRAGSHGSVTAAGTVGGLGDPGRGLHECVRGPGETSGAARSLGCETQQRERGGSPDRSDGAPCCVEHTDSGPVSIALGCADQRDGQRPDRTDAARGTGRPGPTNGLWADADWLLCRDGKWRPVEPGTFPLAHGAASRVGRLRAYGNAIVAEAAEAVIATYLEAERAGFAALDCNGSVNFEALIG